MKEITTMHRSGSVDKNSPLAEKCVDCHYGESEPWFGNHSLSCFCPSKDVGDGHDTYKRDDGATGLLQSIKGDTGQCPSFTSSARGSISERSARHWIGYGR